MKNYKKRLLSFLMVFIMTVSSLPFNTFAQEEYAENNVTETEFFDDSVLDDTAGAEDSLAYGEAEAPQPEGNEETEIQETENDSEITSEDENLSYEVETETATIPDDTENDSAEADTEESSHEETTEASESMEVISEESSSSEITSETESDISENPESDVLPDDEYEPIDEDMLMAISAGYTPENSGMYDLITLNNYAIGNEVCLADDYKYPLTVGCNQTGSQALPGDVNCDGVVDRVDGYMFCDAMYASHNGTYASFKSRHPEFHVCPEHADLDMNGKVDFWDAYSLVSTVFYTNKKVGTNFNYVEFYTPEGTLVHKLIYPTTMYSKDVGIAGGQFIKFITPLSYTDSSHSNQRCEFSFNGSQLKSTELAFGSYMYHFVNVYTARNPLKIYGEWVDVTPVNVANITFYPNREYDSPGQAAYSFTYKWTDNGSPMDGTMEYFSSRGSGTSGEEGYVAFYGVRNMYAYADGMGDDEGYISKGHHFCGWYTTPDFQPGTKLDEDVVLKGDYTLYGKWISDDDTYTYKFHVETLSGDSSSDSFTLKRKNATPSEVVSKINDITVYEDFQDYYKFGGWYMSPDFNSSTKYTGSLTQSQVTPDSTTTVDFYALLIPYTYTVTFNLNYDTAVPAAYETYFAYAEKGFDLPSENPTRSGYRFDGWYYDKGGTTKVTDNKTPKKRDNLTVYAKWTAVTPSSYTVKFYVKNTLKYTKTAQAGKTISDFPANPTGEIYEEFVNWQTKSGTVVTSSTAINEDMDVYANFRIPTFVVKFYKNDGSDTVFKTSNGDWKNGFDLPTTNPTRSGFNFDGWYYNTAGTQPVNDNKVSKKRDATVSVYAKWTAAEPDKVTVKFYVKNNVQYTKQVIPGSAVSDFPPNPSGDWYEEFVNWQTRGGEVFTSSTRVSADTDVYANFRTKTYTVKFYMNDGTGAVHQTVSGDYLNGFSIPISPTRDGFTFAGWFYDTAGTQPVNDNSMSKARDSVVSVYAKWEENEPENHDFTVKFYMNDGTSNVYSSTTGNTATGFSLPSGTPKSNEYLSSDHTYYKYFDGWYYDTSCTRPVRDNNGAYEHDTSDLNIYAKWTAYRYTVNFYSDSKLYHSYQHSDSYDSYIQLPSDPPTKYDYEYFDGWRTSGGTEYTSRSSVRQNLNLYSKFSPYTFTVSFYLNYTGAPYEKYTTASGNTYDGFSLPSNPLRKGYAFTGWYEDANCTKEISRETALAYCRRMAKNNGTAIPLYAGWLRQKPTLSISKSADKTSARSGDAVTYTITVTNSSAYTAYDVEVADVLPSELTFISASDSGYLTMGKVAWTIPELSGGNSKTLTLYTKIK